MKKQPRKTKQWADEAYQALEMAWELLHEEYSNPDEDQKLELVRFAPAIAGLNRGISDKKTIMAAYNFIHERTVEDLRNRGEDEPIYYSIMFLLGYIDAHISFGAINENKGYEIMEYLSEHYDVSDEP